MSKALALLLALPLLAQAEDLEWPSEATAGVARRGLDWLAAQQQADGSFGTDPFPVTSTALGGLALVASGEERHREHVRKCFENLLSLQREDGWISETLPKNSRYQYGSGTTGHAFALLFLATAWRTRAWWWSPGEIEKSGEKWRDAIQKAIGKTEASQTANGGWGPGPNADGVDTAENAAPVVHALACAAKAGFQVQEASLAAARKYFNALTGDDGGTGYGLGREEQKNAREFYLTAAGAAALTGIDADGARTSVCLKRLLRDRPGKEENERSRGGWLFGCLYSALAVAQSGSDAWPEWWGAQRDELRGSQSNDGGWPEPAHFIFHGRVDATAIALLGLTLPQAPFLKFTTETPSDLLRLAEWRVRRNSYAVKFAGEVTVPGKKKQRYSGRLKCKSPARLLLEGEFEEVPRQDDFRLASDGETFSMDHAGKVTAGTSPAGATEYAAAFSLRAGFFVTLLSLPHVVRSKDGHIAAFPEPSEFAEVSSLKRGDPEKVGDRPAIVLRFTVTVAQLSHEAECTLWLDAETFLPLKRAAKGKLDELTFEVAEMFDSASIADIDDKEFKAPK